MIRPLDRDTRGPARGSNAGSAPGPSRRITAASDTHLRPSRFRNDALTVHVTKVQITPKVVLQKQAPFYVLVASRLAFVPPGAPPHTSHRLRFPGWVRELGHELALRRHRGGRAPRTAGNGGGTRRRPRRRRRRSRRFVLPLPPARAPARARAPRPCGAQRGVRADLAARASFPSARRVSRRTRAGSAHTSVAAPPAPHGRAALAVRGERARRHLRLFSAYASTHATPAAAPEPTS